MYLFMCDTASKKLVHKYELEKLIKWAQQIQKIWEILLVVSFIQLYAVYKRGLVHSLQETPIYFYEYKLFRFVAYQ